ncbi:MAG: RrF2 family transcriptional regulator [Coriobacteriia bacterium]
MRLSAKSEYGMLALIELAVAYGDGPLSVREIAENRDMPPAFLEQLLAALRRAGLVEGVRGVRGGFMLARDPSTITALEIVEALEGPLAPTVCSLTDDCGRSSACAAASVWGDVASSVREVLVRWDLATLATSQNALEDHLARMKEQ